MGSRRFDSKGLTRRAGRVAPRSYTIVVCYDGERTEASYFVGWRSVLRTGAIDLRPVLVSSGGNPEAAIARAITAKANDDDYDEYWCVCDVDDSEAPGVARAITMAAAAGISLALSNRCFEIWAALHWDPASSAPVTSEREARRLVARHYPRYAKGPKVIPFSVLYPKTETALKNAGMLRGVGVANPSTDVDLLVRRLLGRQGR